MTTQLMTIAGLVMAGALTIHAQTPQTPQPRTGDTTQHAAKGTDQVITIAGCVTEEKGEAAVAPNAAARADAKSKYSLTNVKMAQSSAVSGLGVAATYQIEGLAEAELKKHVGHQVELTGTVTRPTMTMPATAPATATERAAAGHDKTQDFRATSLKMVSATCPAAK